jgi:transcription elongation factor Elf1
MRFKLTSEDELSRLSGSVSQNKALYEEWKEKTKIKSFGCDRCGSPHYSITGPGFIVCDNCGKDYDVRE